MNFPCHSFILFPHVLLLITREKCYASALHFSLEPEAPFHPPLTVARLQGKYHPRAGGSACEYLSVALQPVEEMKALPD